MRVKNVVDEDFVNYKKPSMFIGTIQCIGKCCIEQNVSFDICQNHEWRSSKTILVDDKKIIERYLNNPITKAIIFGGLEPFEQFDEISSFIRRLRVENGCDDDIVIYTGYNKSEIEDKIATLSQYKNIIDKFGRYLINNKKRYDEVLGIELESEKQYAERL